MKTKIEYAASHSVDTDWFAVDRDGRLALISSGEEGWMPADSDELPADDDILKDALILNSQYICEGLREIDLESDLLKLVTENYNYEKPYETYLSDKEKDYTSCTDMEKLQYDVIKLKEGIDFTDLEIWKNRQEKDKSLILKISSLNDYLCMEMKTPLKALFKDVAEKRIIADSYCDEAFYYYYYPKDDYSTTDCYEQLDDWTDYSAPRFAFKLPERFHNLPKYDISFEGTREFNLEEHTGVCTTGIESYFEDQNGNRPAVLRDYSHIASDNEKLTLALFCAIKEFSSKNVWQLIDKYNVSPLVKDKDGRTAIEVSSFLLDENRASLERCNMPGLACLRIYNMLKLKEKQYVSDQTSST